MALIQGIVDALEKNQKFIPKAETTLQKFKDQFSKLKNSINWMRLLKFSVKGIVPVATAAVTGGVSMIIPTLLSAIKENRDDLSNILSEENAENFLRETLCSEDEDAIYIRYHSSVSASSAIHREPKTIGNNTPTSGAKWPIVHSVSLRHSSNHYQQKFN